MADFQDISMAKQLTPSLSHDPRMVSVMEAVDKELKEIAAKQYMLHLIANIDILPEAIIKLLAWQWHVDFWDDTLTLDQKRKLVKNSIAWHRRKGTPAAVEEVVTTALETAVVKENWEYGGNPYCFRIEMNGGIADTSVINKLVSAIYSVKNTRSHLDGATFFSEANSKIYLGGVTYIHKSIEISHSEFKMPDIQGGLYLGGVTYIHKEVYI
ncbi:MAG: phage tail protein I [Sporomusa sp.]